MHERVRMFAYAWHLVPYVRSNLSTYTRVPAGVQAKACHRPCASMRASTLASLRARVLAAARAGHARPKRVASYHAVTDDSDLVYCSSCGAWGHCARPGRRCLAAPRMRLHGSVADRSHAVEMEQSSCTSISDRRVTE